MPHQIDLELYLKRIGHQGPRTPEEQTLRALHACHVAAIPFENVDVQLDRDISLNLSDIERKLVHNGRGGYCFEQNGLFAAVLELLGFSVQRMMARVRWAVPPEVESPMSHLVLKVEASGRFWLCDVGFGGLSLMRPICFENGGKQHKEFEARRLTKTPEGLMHQVAIKNEWKDLYCIQQHSICDADLEVANWYTSAHPASRFRHALIAARAGPVRRTTLINNELTHRPHGKDPEIRILGSRTELIDTLREAFGIELSSEEAAKLPFRRN